MVTAVEAGIFLAAQQRQHFGIKRPHIDMTSGAGAAAAAQRDQLIYSIFADRLHQRQPLFGIDRSIVALPIAHQNAYHRSSAPAKCATGLSCPSLSASAAII